VKKQTAGWPYCSPSACQEITIYFRASEKRSNKEADRKKRGRKQGIDDKRHTDKERRQSENAHLCLSTDIELSFTVLGLLAMARDYTLQKIGLPEPDGHEAQRKQRGRKKTTATNPLLAPLCNRSADYRTDYTSGSTSLSIYNQFLVGLHFRIQNLRIYKHGVRRPKRDYHLVAVLTTLNAR